MANRGQKITRIEVFARGRVIFQLRKFSSILEFNGSSDYRRKFTGWHNFRAAQKGEPHLRVSRPSVRWILGKIHKSSTAEARRS